MEEEKNILEITTKKKEFKNDIEAIINKKSETFADRVAIFFDKIEFLELSGELKQEVAIKVKKNTTPDRLFRIEIFLSSLIAALGLLQNSVAVVIGAMLIAPLLRPINGISYSISKGEKNFFWISLRVIIVSILISVVMGFISAKIIGFTHETPEILARTSPNIIDLFIAIFSAMIAVLSLGFSRLGESIAGVAMAASLMPPLAVVGIEFALGNYLLAWGAFMLFLANLIAIILVGIIIFWLYGFTPNVGDNQKTSVKRFAFILIVVFVISIPLFHSLSVIKQKSLIKNESRIYLENILKKENSYISVSNLEIESLNDTDVKIGAVVKLPEGINFYDTFKRQLDIDLSKRLSKNVELNIDLIRTANIVSSNNSNDIKNQIYDTIVNDLKSNYEEINIISLEITSISDFYNVKVILGIQDNLNFNSDIFAGLKSKLEERFNKKINFTFIPLTLYSGNSNLDLTPIQIEKNKIYLIFTNFINKNISKGISLKNLNVTINDLDSKANVDLVFDVENQSMNNFTKFIDNLSEQQVSKSVNINLKYFKYEELKISPENIATGSLESQSLISEKR